MNNVWTKKEDQLLSDTSKSYNQILMLLNKRTKKSVYARANRLGYKRDKKTISKINSENQRKEIWDSLINDRYFCEVVDGELLADGCIFKKKIKDRDCYDYAFIAGSIHREYAEYLHGILSPKLNSKAKIRLIKGGTRRGRLCKDFYEVRFSSVIFKNFYDRWYKNGSIKTDIPDDLNISRTICLHWYLGDGSLDSRMDTHMFDLSLHTENFKQKSVIKLQQLLCNLLHIKVSISKTKQKYFRLRTHGDYARNFLNYIGPPPLGCFKYKWRDWKEVEYRESN